MKKHIQINTKKTTDLILKWVKALNRHLSKEDAQMANGHINKKMLNVTNHLGNIN